MKLGIERKGIKGKEGTEKRWKMRGCGFWRGWV